MYSYVVLRERNVKVLADVMLFHICCINVSMQYKLLSKVELFIYVVSKSFYLVDNFFVNGDNNDHLYENREKEKEKMIS